MNTFYNDVHKLGVRLFISNIIRLIINERITIIIDGFFFAFL